MNIYEVPRDQWSSFCDMLNRRHQGTLVNIEMFDTPGLEGDGDTAEIQARVLAEEMPFRGLAAEPDSNGKTLVVVAGEESWHIAHLVRQPLRLLFWLTADGVPWGIQIDQASGKSTLIRLEVDDLSQEQEEFTLIQH